MTKIQKMAKVQESVISRVDGLSTEKIQNNKINIGDVNSVDYQLQLIVNILITIILLMKKWWLR